MHALLRIVDILILVAGLGFMGQGFGFFSLPGQHPYGRAHRMDLLRCRHGFNRLFSDNLSTPFRASLVERVDSRTFHQLVARRPQDRPNFSWSHARGAVVCRISLVSEARRLDYRQRVGIPGLPL